MNRIWLVHWHDGECRERCARLEQCGFEVHGHWQHDAGGVLTRGLRAACPDAVVIDLARLPSHGRAVATWLGERKALRATPVVFVPGDPEKTERLRQAFPEAVFAPWTRLCQALRRAIAAPPREPVVPRTPDYSGTPLPKKLGLRAGGVMATVRAPADWATILGELPEGAVQRRGLDGPRDVVVLFCRALSELRRDWSRAAACLRDGGALWVAWPKKAARVQTDLDDRVVRSFGLDQGLVDTKVCAIDATWSGLRFNRRRPRAATARVVTGRR